MITNLQDYIQNHKRFNTLTVDGVLFVEYQCLVEDQEADIWTHDNYFAYVLGGKKKMENKVW